MTNAEFAKEDVEFNICCKAVGLPTKGHILTRQASKWRRKKGLTYAYQHNLPLTGSCNGKAK